MGRIPFRIRTVLVDVHLVGLVLHVILFVAVVLYRCFTFAFTFRAASAFDFLFYLLVFLSRPDRFLELSAGGKLAGGLCSFAHPDCGGRRTTEIGKSRALPMTLSTNDVCSDAEALLAAHTDLVARVRNAQGNNRRLLRTLPSPPHDLLRLPLIPTPSPSPSPSPPSSPLLAPRPKPPQRPDLPPSKRARLARYPNYVPEEETIRNDYSQRYVDSGEWPQNWVLGAELERRFEE